MNKKGFVTLVCLLLTVGLCCRAQSDWRQVYEEVMDCGTDEADEVGEDYYDLLEQLARQPLNINTATPEELELLPFLSSQQVMDIVEYRDRYKGFASLGELRMVRSLDFQQTALLPFFVVAETKEEKHFPRIENIVKNGRHTLAAKVRVPFYERRGDRNGYLGYRYRHTASYEFDYGQYVRLGLTAAQDAGEPFMAAGNRMGYDLYNYYLQVKKLGRIENLVVGKYKVSMGMGLVANTSFSLGKLAALQSMGRQQRALRPHASRSEADYFQGAAATVCLAPRLSLTLFGSHRAVDATLNDDGSAATLLYSGYHRTPTEMEKKYNTHLTATGGSLMFSGGGLHVGLNAVYTHTDRQLEPNRNVLYRRYYAHGQDFLNASIDYGWRTHRLSFSGETATDRQGHIGTVNTAGLQLTDNLSLMVLHRFYSYRYTSLYGHSFSAGSRPQNENGCFVGVTWRPFGHWQLQAYADYAHFPWARYLVSEPSNQADLLLQAVRQSDKWTLTVRYRAQLGQKDNADKNGLAANDTHRARLQLAFTPTATFSLKTQADYVFNRYKKDSRGWLLGQQAVYHYKKISLQLTAAYFHTDDYQSRVYLYEPHLEGDFSFPTYFGRGLRGALMARADVGRRLRLKLRLGHTRYFDRDAIGSGLQMIDSPRMTDLDVGVRLRL